MPILVQIRPVVWEENGDKQTNKQTDRQTHLFALYIYKWPRAVCCHIVEKYLVGNRSHLVESRGCHIGKKLWHPSHISKKCNRDRTFLIKKIVSQFKKYQYSFNFSSPI